MLWTIKLKKIYMWTKKCGNERYDNAELMLKLKIKIYEEISLRLY